MFPFLEESDVSKPSFLWIGILALGSLSSPLQAWSGDDQFEFAQDELCARAGGSIDAMNAASFRYEDVGGFAEQLRGEMNRTCQSEKDVSKIQKHQRQYCDSHCRRASKLSAGDCKAYCSIYGALNDAYYKVAVSMAPRVHKARAELSGCRAEQRFGLGLPQISNLGWKSLDEVLAGDSTDGSGTEASRAR